MATPRDKKREMIDIGPDGVPVFPVDNPPPQSRAPDTDATRKTEEMYWSMLGSDKEGTGYLTVHYLGNGKGGSEMFVSKIPSDKYTEDELLDVVKRVDSPKIHPGTEGDYRVRLYIHDGTGFRKRGEKLFTVLAGDAPKTNTAMTPITANGTDPALVALLGQNAALLQRLAEPKEPKPSETMSFLKETAPLWMPALGTALTALLSRKPDNSLTVMREAFTIAGIAKEMQEDREPATDAGSPWAPVILKGLEGLSAMMSQKALMVPGAPAAPVAPGAAPAQATIGMPQHPLYGHLVNMLSLADEDQDPDNVAREVWATLPEEHRASFAAFLDRKEAIRDMIQVHPDVALYAPWFGDLRAALLDLARGSVQESGQQEQPGGRVINGGGPDQPDTPA